MKTKRANYTKKRDPVCRPIQVLFHSDKIKGMCKTSINGMPKRVKALMAAKCGQTKY